MGWSWSNQTIKFMPKKKTVSRVNEAGNYTKPEMRKRLFKKIKAGSRWVSESEKELWFYEFKEQP
jgi:hypothetical protein